ncbi:hypothetical protein C0J52_12398 [Blattella germanica]|nr:hypothetical protein C0J52_12398 [Blattella germanica]
MLAIKTSFPTEIKLNGLHWMKSSSLSGARSSEPPCRRICLARAPCSARWSALCPKALIPIVLILRCSKPSFLASCYQSEDASKSNGSPGPHSTTIQIPSTAKLKHESDVA